MSEIVVSQEGMVVEVLLNRPKKRNAITFAMYDSLAGALRAAGEDPKVRVVLLAAAGDTFCAGNDINDFLSNATLDPASAPPLRFIEALIELDKPLVVAVHGAAVGIGTTMLLHADLVYASAAAEFSTPFAKLALVPEAASSLLLPQRIGQAAARDMLFRGVVVNVERAADLGLVNAISGTGQEVLSVARSRARELASMPPAAMRLTKSLLRADPDAIRARVKLEAKLFAERVASDEAREAFSAFLQRRPVDFSAF